MHAASYSFTVSSVGFLGFGGAMIAFARLAPDYSAREAHRVTIWSATIVTGVLFAGAFAYLLSTDGVTLTSLGYRKDPEDDKARS
ncbi:MAG TPA: hypothetical protein VF669_23925 [Tepidisphaeraceae bacterium]